MAGSYLFTRLGFRPPLPIPHTDPIPTPFHQATLNGCLFRAGGLSAMCCNGEHAPPWPCFSPRKRNNNSAPMRSKQHCQRFSERFVSAPAPRSAGSIPFEPPRQ